MPLAASATTRRANLDALPALAGRGEDLHLLTVDDGERRIGLAVLGPCLREPEEAAVEARERRRGRCDLGGSLLDRGRRSRAPERRLEKGERAIVTRGDGGERARGAGCEGRHEVAFGAAPQRYIDEEERAELCGIEARRELGGNEERARAIGEARRVELRLERLHEASQIRIIEPFEHRLAREAELGDGTREGSRQTRQLADLREAPELAALVLIMDDARAHRLEREPKGGDEAAPRELGARDPDREDAERRPLPSERGLRARADGPCRGQRAPCDLGRGLDRCARDRDVRLATRGEPRGGAREARLGARTDEDRTAHRSFPYTAGPAFAMHRGPRARA